MVAVRTVTSLLSTGVALGGLFIASSATAESEMAPSLPTRSNAMGRSDSPAVAPTVVAAARSPSTSAPPPSAKPAAALDNGLAPPTQASPPPRNSLTGDRVALAGHVGIGAPAGAVGVDLEMLPVMFIALGAGVGLGGDGPQVALGGRSRFPLLNFRNFVTFGSSWSFGRYESTTRSTGLACVVACVFEHMGPRPAIRTWKRASWHNLKAGYDYLTQSGRSMLRVALGYGYMLNPQAFECDASDDSGRDDKDMCTRTSGTELVYADFQYGFSL